MSDFVCHVREGLDERTREVWREACEELDYYGDHEGKQYCVLHFPGEDKKGNFSKALDEKLKDGAYFFPSVYFPGNQSFESHTFSAQANFSKAIFRGSVDFYEAVFQGEVNFDEADFHEEANFQKTNFECTVRFVGTTFKGPALFWQAKFKEDAYFFETKFLKRTGFSAHKNYKAFNVDCDREVLFDRVEIEKPELFAFRSIQLRPSWFIYVENAQELTFHEVSWYGLREGPKPRNEEGHDKSKAKKEDEDGTLGDREAFRKEVDALEVRKNKGLQHPRKKGISQPHQLLASTYRRLSRNYEDNREYPVANEFHYWSMNALRMRNRSRFGLVNGLYWALSGYGVRARRALGWLLTIAVVFAVLYMLLGPNALQVSSASNPVEAREHAGQAVVYSLSTMARLNPEPKPDPGLFQFLVTLEGILGPLQIALLALAIRRKVMR